MRCLFLTAALLLAGCGSPHQAETKGAEVGSGVVPLAAVTSASIELPTDDETFPDGPQGDVLNRNCLACHSVAMVRQQPPLTRKQWTATVDKMREAYGAPIDPAQTEAIVDALMTVAPAKK